jgi:two-component system, chemotaxis family, protein-glutamate methylesterase/glutaminase
MAEPPKLELHEGKSEAVQTGQRDILVMGASAGGVETLGELMSGLPAEFPAAIFVVLHLLPTAHSVLPEILDRAGPLPAGAATRGDDIERGRIYVAPPDRHLLLMPDGVRLTRGPRENGHRPALDPLFRSAARAFRERVIGIVLSGSLDDGTAGLRLVKRMGGTTVAQDPEDALYPGMPASAVANEAADYVVSVENMPGLLCDLVDAPIEIHAGPADLADLDVAHADRSDDDPTEGMLTGLTCPDCGGALWEHLDSDGYVRFKCHVGHAYSPDSLEIAQSQGLETALWSAVRTLEERGDLFRRLARRAGTSARPRFEVKAEEVAHHIDVLRQSIERLGRLPVNDEVEPVIEAEGTD